MAVYKFVARAVRPIPCFNHQTSLMQSYQAAISRITPHIHRVIKTSTPQTRHMAFFLPRVAFGPASCGPARNELAPLFSLFDDTFNEVARVSSRQSRRSFAPRFDVKEAKESYSLEGELPGIDQKDIQIEFTDEHTLTIKGRSEHHTESSTPPSAAVESSEKPAIQEGTATPASDDGSVKSHQPTVEDEEALAHSSAAAESSQVAAPAAAEEPTKAEAPKHQYWVSERSVGSFERSFSFPSRVDQEAVKASLKNGILSIVVPKAKVPESRRINIE